MTKNQLICLASALLLALITGNPLIASPDSEKASQKHVQSNSLTPAELADGWILLFDGKTLFGWRAASKANWKVVDGVITADKGEVGLLHTTSQWGNFRLKLDFRASPGANSGVFLRSPPTVTNVRRAYEVNIAPATDPFPTGNLVQRQRKKMQTTGHGWRNMDITADGNHFIVKVDGHVTANYFDHTPLGRGYLGLQFRTGKIEFRNIKLKPLGMKPLFNGRNLEGWKTYPKMKSVVEVTSKGEISIKNGPGQLETVGQYGDFTLQLDAFVRGQGLNSGIFFRCIPGEKMNGYESQIHNGFVGGDRRKPEDCGAGGIFRRMNARFIVANDFEWFTKTIHADGPHMAVWVNGYQVSDWTDRRKPNENPRRGLRLKPGTIMIQGHDPTTDLLFRNLRISELPKR